MAKFVFRIDSYYTVKDTPEIVWSPEELCWLVNQHLFKTDNYNNYYRPPEVVKEKSLTAVIIGFKDFYTKERYCAQFAAVVNGILPKTHRFSVLTIYDNDAKHIVSRLEKNR